MDFLRHTFATNILMKWVDGNQNVMSLLPYLSTYMGHVDMRGTLYYVHLLPERLQKTAGIDWASLSSVYGEVHYEKD